MAKTTAATAAAQLFNQRLGPAQGDSLTTLPLIQGVERALNSGFDAATNSWLTEEEAAREWYFNSVALSAGALGRRPASTRKAIEKLDRSVRTPQYHATPQWYTNQRLIRKMLLANPYYSKSIPWDEGNPRARAIGKQINLLISKYPHEVRPKLSAFIGKIVANANSRIVTQRAQAYVWGPTGTGKTYFGDQLGEILDLPVIKMNLSNDGNINNLLPMEESYGYQSDVDVKRAFGDLALKIIECGYVNPIILLDEFSALHHFAEAQLKRLLDPTAKEIPIPQLDVSIDWSKVTVIILSNDKLTDSALLARLTYLAFDRLDPSVKNYLLDKAIEEVAQTYKRRFTQDRYDRKLAVCKSYSNFMLEKDENNPGVRVLRSVADGLVHLVFNGRSTSDRRITRYLTDTFEGLKTATAERRPMGDFYYHGGGY
ncbi:AAA family ATPase [Paraburkholderia sp. NMBU_R16]|uniref:ATP-binding protein n=1 Tax=Paraburkholderia sp. NMBU_R16 TaxID=2698676 RepID=UPI0015660FB6|nr:ATP-binding protein [Paraburkholderia sp. NMBU_R16]NRO99491.1 AAA family ATPase [Paraburkholderia sp. NMBU_R16]